MDAIAIDFETANERRDSACAVGLAWIDGGRVVRRETRLIRPPELRFSPGNIRVHGILPADVRGQPNLPEAMAEFLPDLSDRLVLAHNAGFDMSVLSASLAAWGRPVPAVKYLCTLRIARQVFPDPAGCGLAKVAGRLGIRFEHHDAGEDAYACAEIALAAMRERDARSVAELPGLLKLPALVLSGGYRPDPEDARSTASRALLVGRRPPGKADLGLRFAIRGSTGNRYEVVLEERSTGPYLRCDCIAGRHRKRCRHVDAIVEGDVTALVSGNFGDVERLRVRLTAAMTPVEPLRVRSPIESRRQASFG
ncbi:MULTISPECIES: 3'-5' exonuclease [Methylobacterium]|nr:MULTISPECIES: 3'-5' exonuclease [Methylobacterium]TXN24516.1 3'-5' exonuclease [Methylobacterium sp. WL9]